MEGARTTAYYQELLSSIERRRQGAPEERRALLARQAEVARAEEQRRLREIEDKYRPAHSLRRLRLHLVLAPALHLPLWVRRGDRRYPFALCWSLHGGDFLPVPAPGAGSAPRWSPVERSWAVSPAWARRTGRGAPHRRCS